MIVGGPDGVGKTSVARALCERVQAPAYFHFRPPIVTPLLACPPLVSVPPPTKGSPSGSRVLGVIRLTRNFLWFWAAYLYRVRPALQAGALVVGDRWAYGYLVQPFPLKYYGPRWLAAWAIRMLPQPDLVANLVAPPGVVFSRKQELNEAQIEKEMEAWSALPVEVAHDFEATPAPESVASDILSFLGMVGHVQRHKSFPPGWNHLSIPVSSKEAALAGIAMYTASRVRGVAVQRLAWHATKMFGPGVLPGRGRRWAPPFAPGEWLALLEEWKIQLGGFDDFAAYRPRQAERMGAALLLLHRGDPVAFVKVGQDQKGLNVERAALEAVAAFGPKTFAAPEVLGSDSVGSLHYLALSPMPRRIHTAPNNPNLSAITAEIEAGLETLPRPDGTPDHWLPMHGDLTPWNLRQSGDRMLLIDWEEAGWGPPGADLILFGAARRALGGQHPEHRCSADAVQFWIDRLTAEDGWSSERFRRRMVDALIEMGRQS